MLVCMAVFLQHNYYEGEGSIRSDYAINIPIQMHDTCVLSFSVT